MNITTLLNPGETFFAIENGKIKEHTVDMVSAMSPSSKAVDKTITVRYYPVTESGSYISSKTFDEKEVYKTKELLLKGIQS